MNDHTVFIRYQPIIDDWTSFQVAIGRPLPTCIWTNTLRTTPDRLAKLFAADGLEFEPLAWYPGGFQFRHDFKPGRHWAYQAGLYHVQEAVSMLPVTLLRPEPGQRVLDLCAAPGNKTAQIAVSMANSGTVVANDINFSRMRALRHTLDRLGLVNTSISNADGANYPKTAGLFDRVLVDVPCSCEGTCRKDPSVLRRTGHVPGLKRSGLQHALLRKAVQRCKPGGRIVYATCTFAPEENEVVVDTILREYGPDVLRIVPAHINGFTSAEGLTGWHDLSFHPSLKDTMRIWPHHNDTGGFFIAVIEKRASGPAALTLEANRAGSVSAVQKANPLSVTDRVEDLPAARAAVEIVTERFGILPERFADHAVFVRSRGRIYLVSRDHRPPVEPKPDGAGLLFMKTRIKYPKLSTAGSLAFGAWATRNFIDLAWDQVQAYLDRQDFRVSVDQGRHCTGLGYVLAKYRGYVLGVALFQPDTSGGGLVSSMFPKGWSPNKGKRPS